MVQPFPSWDDPQDSLSSHHSDHYILSASWGWGRYCPQIQKPLGSHYSVVHFSAGHHHVTVDFRKFPEASDQCYEVRGSAQQRANALSYQSRGDALLLQAPSFSLSHPLMSPLLKGISPMAPGL